MGVCREIITPLHRRTTRDYIGRMTDDKVHCMEVARRYGRDYWDGDRRYGYGGYRYDGRWRPVAEQLITTYGLNDTGSVLDVGCGKAFLLYELRQLLPGLSIRGFDISTHALSQARPEVQADLFPHRADEPYPFADESFDLVLSLTTLHNLPLPALACALSEMARVGRAGYVAVESYRNERELFNLQCWALTCEAFLCPDAWRWIFATAGYSGDYEFIYFE